MDCDHHAGRGGFLPRSRRDLHDGRVREAHLWTEHAVGEDLAMTVGGDWDTSVRLLEAPPRRRRD